MGLSQAQREALASWLQAATGAESVELMHLERLGGGAIQENWAVEIACRGGSLDGRHELVLRTDAASRIPVSWNRVQEFCIVQAAHRTGVTVPEPLAVCEDPAALGRAFFLMRRVAGEARGHRLVRDPALLKRGEALAGRLGAELARLHQLRPPVAGLGFIPVPDRSPALARVAEYRRHLDALGAAEPVLEWALAWLERRSPARQRVCLVHADFRTGNYLVADGELQAVLDWEFAAFSDPHEDLGWMLARYWRFGAYEREAGGIGSRAAFLEGYERAGGGPIDHAAVSFWEVMATVRWAVIALMQAARHYAGRETSLELALTAHVLPVLELDLLDRIAEIEAGGAP